LISNGWRQEALAAATAVDLSALTQPAAVDLTITDPPVTTIDVSDFVLTLAGCDLTKADLGTGAGKIQWQWVNVSAVGTALTDDTELGATGIIAPNSHIIPLAGKWVAGEKLVLRLNLTYDGVPITKSGKDTGVTTMTLEFQ